MKLPKQEVELFYKLMWALQFYVNQKLKIHPELKSVNDYDESDIETKVEVRNALYDHIEIIDSFIQENPQGFSEQNLTIISRWKNFISGDFLIERLLKKYTVFIQDDKIYGVQGLSQGFDEMIFNYSLPVYVNTVLLPFKSTIIYDGLLGFRNILFGGGIKRDLKETYMRAKQNNRIIDGLDKLGGVNQGKTKAKSLKNWQPELKELAGRVKKLRGSVDHPAIYSPAFSLVKASVEFAQIAVSDAKDQDHLHKALQKVRRAYNKTNTVLYREDC